MSPKVQLNWNFKTPTINIAGKADNISLNDKIVL
jgi:hypothetical protein